MQNKSENSMEQKRRELRERLHKALKENNEEEGNRVLAEFEELDPGFLDKRFEGISLRMKEIGRRVWDAEQQPNLARCIIALMEELKDTGLWDEETNSTYELANKASQSYDKAEKKRVEYLATKAAYRRAYDCYILDETKLAFNLISKFLDPLGETTLDPLKWYLTASGVIKVCKAKGVQITVPTLRKYQQLGLIPKPIRLGRKARYSLLTVLRVLIIDRGKKDRLTLTGMKATIEASLKATLAAYDDKYPGDRTQTEHECVSMSNLTISSFEKLYQSNKEIQDNFFSRVVREYEATLAEKEKSTRTR